MKRTITEENLLDLLLHGTAQDLQDTIDTIHPADILDLLHKHKEHAQSVLNRLPDDILADIVEEEDDEDAEDADECDCEDCADDTDDEDDAAEEENPDDDLIAYACPNCGAELTFHANDVDFDENTLCPNCHQPIFPEIDEESEEETEE